MHISHEPHKPNSNPATWRTITTLNHLPQLIGEP